MQNQATHLLRHSAPTTDSVTVWLLQVMLKVCFSCNCRLGYTCFDISDQVTLNPMLDFTAGTIAVSLSFLTPSLQPNFFA